MAIIASIHSALRLLIWLLELQWSPGACKNIFPVSMFGFRCFLVTVWTAQCVCPLLWCGPVSTCQTQTRLQHQKTRARCAARAAWPPPPPTRATATQPSSTGSIVSSRVRPPHRPPRPPRPTRVGGPSQTPPHTQPWTPTPPLLLWPTWWHTPSSVSNTQEQPHARFSFIRWFLSSLIRDALLTCQQKRPSPSQCVRHFGSWNVPCVVQTFQMRLHISLRIDKVRIWEDAEIHGEFQLILAN